MADIHHTTRRGCVLTARDLTVIKRKFDRTCEELGVYAEDDQARHALGRALLAAVARGDAELLADGASDEVGTETLFFEGEELVVPLAERPGH
jgi:hypothetical protein